MSAKVKLSGPEIRLPFEMGECLGLLTSCANMLLAQGMKEEADEALAHARSFAALAEKALPQLLLARDDAEGLRALGQDGVTATRVVAAGRGERGVDYPCERCGALADNTHQNGWQRCNNCGYPGK